MKIKTVGDLKRELKKIQDESGLGDDTPVWAPVQAYTQAHPADAFPISFLHGGYGGLCVHIALPEGLTISDRRPNTASSRRGKAPRA